MAKRFEAPALMWRRVATLQLAAAFVAGALVSSDARAEDSMQCRNGRLINTGMAAAEVIGRCGEPKSRVVDEIPVQARTRNGNVVQTGTTRAERWIYSRGQGQFDAQLTFEDDKLRRIDFLTQP
jgi:uncharacterized low-complexity protein